VRPSGAAAGDRSADPATTGPNAAPASKTTGAEAARSLPRVAMLSFSSPNTSSPNGPPVASLLRDRLAQLGRVDGKTIVLDERYAKGDPQVIERIGRRSRRARPTSSSRSVRWRPLQCARPPRPFRS
jgi:hypothetical protein